MAKNPFLEWALYYARERHWRVFPLAPHQKVPRKGSRGLTEATTDEQQIERWWKETPTANIGVRTGDEVFVIDEDPRHGGDQTRAWLVGQHGALADTLRATTPNDGAHRFYQMPEQAVIPTRAPLRDDWPGIDVRGVGGYVAVHPSLVVNDRGKLRRYEWDGVDGEDGPVNPADGWLIDAILNRGGAAPGGNGAGPVELPERLQEGRRDATIFRMACAFRRARADYADVVERLIEYDQKHCAPPLGAKMVTAKVRSAWRYPAGDGADEVFEEPAAARPRPTRERSSMAYNADCPEPKPIIDPILYPGLTILGGRPKAGKSWLALQMGIAVVNQLKLAGYLAVQKRSKALYVSLEDRKPQLKKRLHLLVPDAGYLEGLDLMFELAPLLAGGAAELDQTLTEEPVDVLIVDSLLAAVQQTGRKNMDIMQADYNIIRTLRELATKHAIALLLIAHTRKAPGDFLDLIQGTTGTTAAADAVWVLQKTPEGKAILSVTGREIAENTFGLERAQDSPAWVITGEGDAVTQSDARQDILQLLKDKGGDKGMTPTAIAKELRKSISGVTRLLAALLDLGLVLRNGRGNYNVPGTTEPDDTFHE